MLFSSFFGTGSVPDHHYRIRCRFLYIWPVWDIDAISRIYLDWKKPDPTRLRQDRSRSHPAGISVQARWSLSVRTCWLRQDLHSPSILFFGNPLRPILRSIFTPMNYVTCSNAMYDMRRPSVVLWPSWQKRVVRMAVDMWEFLLLMSSWFAGN